MIISDKRYPWSDFGGVCRIALQISASVRDMQWHDKASEHRVRKWWKVRGVKVQKSLADLIVSATAAEKVRDYGGTFVRKYAL